MIKQCCKFILLMIVFNKIQASPTVVSYGGTGLSTTTAYAVICGGTISTGALQSIASVGTSGQALLSAGAGALPAFGAPLSVGAGGTGVATIATGSIVIGAGTSAVTPLAIGTSGFVLGSNGTTPGWVQGSVVQTVSTSTSAYFLTTTALPNDNTVPQNTEGDEVLTLSITPKNTANILHIFFSTFGTVVSTSGCASALFQDSTAGALAAQYIHRGEADGPISAGAYGGLKYRMTAGTTSSTTFKIRIGASVGGFQMNGNAGARRFGGVGATSLTIVETSV